MRPMAVSVATRQNNPFVSHENGRKSLSLVAHTDRVIFSGHKKKLAEARKQLEQAQKKLEQARLQEAKDWHDLRIATYGSLQPDLMLERPFTAINRRFAVIGDAGNGNHGQLAIGEQMQEVYKTAPFGSVLVLGDNVYEKGEPKLFKERIFDPYKQLWMQGVRFFPILGNHDVKAGHADKQLKYWGSQPYYQLRLGPVEIFALDTTTMLPGFEGCYKEGQPDVIERTKAQLTWLDEALGKSTAPMKFVMGHYPIYSSGFHGIWEKLFMKRTMRGKMKQMLEPILKKHGVGVYIAGHDHHYERTKPVDGVTHIVSGAAGKLYNLVTPFRTYAPEQAACKWKRHFMLFDIQDDGSLRFDVISKKGKVLDTGVITPPPKPVSAGISDGALTREMVAAVTA